MFTFNDEFIAEMCGGLNDDDTRELFLSGVEAMHDEVEQHVSRRKGYPVDVTLEGDEFVVELTEEEWAAEFGDASTPMEPKVRSGFIQSISDARRAFDRVVNDLG